MKLEIANNLLKINGNLVSFPISFPSLEKLLGLAWRHISTEHNHIYTWDALGLFAYSKNGQEVEGIVLDFSSTGYDFSPSSTFASGFTIEHVDFRQYLRHHIDQFEKLTKYTENGSFSFGNILAFFNIKDGNIVSVCLEKNIPPQPKVYSDKYSFKAIEGEKIEFSDFNFKLAVVQILMYEKEVLKPKFDLYEFVENYREREIDIEAEGYDFIPEVVDYFQKLEVDKKYTEEIVEIYQDGSDEIYGALIRFWDGTDDAFNIKDFEDIKYFKNLREMQLFYSEDIPEIIEKLAKHNIRAECI